VEDFFFSDFLTATFFAFSTLRTGAFFLVEYFFVGAGCRDFFPTFLKAFLTLARLATLRLLRAEDFVAMRPLNPLV
jgi:hypothetical protein